MQRLELIDLNEKEKLFAVKVVLMKVLLPTGFRGGREKQIYQVGWTLIVIKAEASPKLPYIMNHLISNIVISDIVLF